MVANQPIIAITDLPAEMVSAVAFDATRDVERVWQFLEALGLPSTAESPRYLPPRFLLYLGAALRLLNWEVQGFFFHRAAGLPESHQAFQEAGRSLHDPASDPTELYAAIVQLSLEHFAWSGGRDWQSSIALDQMCEDKALEALAGYLWTIRHDAVPPSSPY